MTPSELRSIGEKLYGPFWQIRMAEALPVSTRSIRNWLKGVHKITERTARQIRALQPDRKS